MWKISKPNHTKAMAMKCRGLNCKKRKLEDFAWRNNWRLTSRNLSAMWRSKLYLSYWKHSFNEFKCNISIQGPKISIKKVNFQDKLFYFSCSVWRNYFLLKWSTESGSDIAGEVEEGWRTAEAWVSRAALRSLSLRSSKISTPCNGSARRAWRIANCETVPPSTLLFANVS